MSWSQASIHAYDVMGNVFVTATVRQSQPVGEDPKETVTVASTTFPGVGEDDPHEWLRDALVGLLEAL